MILVIGILSYFVVGLVVGAFAIYQNRDDWRATNEKDLGRGVPPAVIAWAWVKGVCSVGVMWLPLLFLWLRDLWRHRRCAR